MGLPLTRRCTRLYQTACSTPRVCLAAPLPSPPCASTSYAAPAAWSSGTTRFDNSGQEQARRQQRIGAWSAVAHAEPAMQSSLAHAGPSTPIDSACEAASSSCGTSTALDTPPGSGNNSAAGDTPTSQTNAPGKPPKPPPPLPTAIHPSQDLADISAFANGALLIDKPLEWTSFDVCAKVRNTLYRHLGKLKVGHAGTLDPMATGLLILCTGKGTKSIDTFVSMSKRYSGTLRLGEGTVTYDSEAEVSERLPWEHITDEDVQRAVTSSLLGDILQVPPMYSALKVKGQKLYHLARDGQEIEREARPIRVDSFDVTRDPHDRQSLHFMVECSKGTYVRTLAYDLGRALGTVAHLTALRRESIGKYNVKDAWNLAQLLDQIQKGRLQARSPDSASAQ